jgi:predicted ABC-type transport system involved in lysophospholipase L1 biosynthesis ATPase subunit
MSVIHISALQKHYGALRPLRINELDVKAGERVAIGGLDTPAAEILVNLVTGATLPDEGTVRTFGASTADIKDGDAWLASLDRFGIVSSRAVLLEGSTLQQNLALPFTLELDPVPPSIAARVAALAAECGIPEDALSRRGGDLPAHVRARTHLARAIALHPQVLLIEHPTADVDESARGALADDFAAAIGGRGAAALILTMDVEFAGRVAHRSLTLQPATGALVPWTAKRRWFR